MEVKTLTCGCCSNGCVCQNHMDIPNGRPPKKCEMHEAEAKNAAEVILEAFMNGKIAEEF